MSRYGISMQTARRLQKWTLEVSGASKFLKDLPKLPSTKKIKPGLYVSYEIDKNDLDDGIDWPTPAAATIYAVINNEPEFIGEIRAYQFETYWLFNNENDLVDTAENWWALINEKYQELIKSE